MGPGIYASVLSGIFNPGVAQALAGFGSPNFHEAWARLFEVEVILVVALWTVSGGPDRFSAITAFGLLVATLFAQENLGTVRRRASRRSWRSTGHGPGRCTWLRASGATRRR